MPENIIITPSGGTIQFIDTGNTTTTLTSDGIKLNFSAVISGTPSRFFSLSNVANEGLQTTGMTLNVSAITNTSGTLIIIS